jgi:hypothetical protein
LYSYLAEYGLMVDVARLLEHRPTQLLLEHEPRHVHSAFEDGAPERVPGMRLLFERKGPGKLEPRIPGKPGANMLEVRNKPEPTHLARSDTQATPRPIGRQANPIGSVHQGRSLQQRYRRAVPGSLPFRRFDSAQPFARSLQNCSGNGGVGLEQDRRDFERERGARPQRPGADLTFDSRANRRRTRALHVCPDTGRGSIELAEHVDVKVRPEPGTLRRLGHRWR